jgi:hypothetical protein
MWEVYIIDLFFKTTKIGPRKQCTATKIVVCFSSGKHTLGNTGENLMHSVVSGNSNRVVIYMQLPSSNIYADGVYNER